MTSTYSMTSTKSRGDLNVSSQWPQRDLTVTSTTSQWPQRPQRDEFAKDDWIWWLQLTQWPQRRVGVTSMCPHSDLYVTSQWPQRLHYDPNDLNGGDELAKDDWIWCLQLTQWPQRDLTVTSTTSQWPQRPLLCALEHNCDSIRPYQKSSNQQRHPEAVFEICVATCISDVVFITGSSLPTTSITTC